MSPKRHIDSRIKIIDQTFDFSMFFCKFESEQAWSYFS